MEAFNRRSIHCRLLGVEVFHDVLYKVHVYRITADVALHEGVDKDAEQSQELQLSVGAHHDVQELVHLRSFSNDRVQLNRLVIE